MRPKSIDFGRFVLGGRMPWEVKSEGGKFCTFNKMTGKKVACFPDKEKAEDHAKALYANTPKKEMKALEDDMGLTLLRVAYTNEPHLRLRNHPISVVTIDGQEYVRHPIAVAGRYKHPNGDLNLNSVPITDPKHKFNRIIANHYARVQDAGVYVRPGHVSRESWAWLSPEHGGWLAYEEDKGDSLLVGYGKMTSQERLQAIKNGDWQYVSADLHLKYSSNAILEGSSPDVISWDSLRLQEGSMDEVTIKKSEYDELLAKVKAAEELQAKLATAEAKSADLEAKLKGAVQLQEPEIPPALKLRLEEQDRRLALAEAQVKKAERDSLINRFKGAVKLATTPDRQGNIVDAFTLELAKKAVFGQEIGTGEEVIKLEASTDPEAIVRHEIQVFTYLLENIPRSLRGVAQTGGDEQQLALSSNGIVTLGSKDDLAEVDQMIGDAWKSQ